MFNDPTGNILADASDPVWKVGAGIVVFILWGIAAMASAVRKQKQQERLRQQQLWAEVQRETGGLREATPPFAVQIPVPPPPPPPLAARVPPEWMMPQGVIVQPPPVPVPVPQRAQRRGKQSKRNRQVGPVAAAPAQVVQATLEAIQASRSPAPAPSINQPAPPPANAAALHRWLSARTLRSQFILTEILQPPLALREPRQL